MKIQPFFHVETGSLTYVLSDSGQAMMIDPVLDYRDGVISHEHIDSILKFIKQKELDLRYILETHIHADHLSAAQYVKQLTGAQTVISKRILDVFEAWKTKFGLKSMAKYDVLVDEDTPLSFQGQRVEVLETPGHTPACVSYRIGDNVFVGDTLFAPDLGTSRADFPGGNAELLYQSIQRLYELPNNTNVYLCHDYPPVGVSPTSCVTMEWQKKRNVMLNQHTSKSEYLIARTNRDKSLKPPKLLEVAVPYNLTFSLPS